ncbi:extracellular matrix regulator RemB [Virgibacillus xinjiangensis]|uniref:Extracellular matrix regulator RemB n=1 Tax=Virgibacillus xinjiangensis TaxID=393090 RepID=A0ABV7CXE4_9BACI
MFIHIGNDHVIQSNDVIAILDFHLISSSSIMEEMVTEWAVQKKVLGPMEDAKSVMITKDIIYYSQLSVSTLKKRASMISTISKLDDYSEEIKDEESDQE